MEAMLRAKDTILGHRPLELAYPFDLVFVEGHDQSYNFVPLGTPFFLTQWHAICYAGRWMRIRSANKAVTIPDQVGD
jgi:hypothetical protein